MAPVNIKKTMTALVLIAGVLKRTPIVENTMAWERYMEYEASPTALNAFEIFFPHSVPLR